MPKTKISEFSATPANNTDIDSINIAEGCAPSGINDAIRELMAQLKDFQVGSAGDPVTIGGVLTVTAGTAALPAITTAGDTNTGIFFPAADTIAFAEGGAEAMRIDSAGNLGLGVTPSAWGSSYKAVQIKNSLSLWTAGSDDAYFSNNVYYDGTNRKYVFTAPAAEYEQADGEHRWYSAASGTAGNNITFTQALTLAANGRLGIGTTSPLKSLDISFASGARRFLVSYDDSIISIKGAGSTDGPENIRVIGDTIRFSTGTTGSGNEAARITSAGEFLVGTTSLVAAGQVSIAYDSSHQGMAFKPAVNNTTFVLFKNASSSDIGSINTAGGSTTVYSTSSDYRLKENIAPMTGALATVSQLKPVTYTWKESGEASQGFIAHELQAIVPDAVVGEKDAVNKDGSIKPQGIDTSFLVATLTAAIQELKAEFDAYKASHP
jgi:hypothetical protein